MHGEEDTRSECEPDDEGKIGKTRYFLWGRFRPGNTYSGQGSNGFLRECLKILPQRIKNIRARGDSSFFHGDFLEEMERQRIEYAIAARLYASIQYLLGRLDYRDIGDGIAVGEFRYLLRQSSPPVAHLQAHSALSSILNSPLS